MINWQDLANRMQTAKAHGQALAATASAREAAREVENVSRTLTQMQQRMDKMAMVLLALVTLVQNKLSLSEEELFAHLQSMVKMIEASRPDANQRGRCPKCDGVVPVNAKRCQFCGAELAAAGPSNPLEALLS